MCFAYYTDETHNREMVILAISDRKELLKPWLPKSRIP